MMRAILSCAGCALALCLGLAAPLPAQPVTAPLSARDCDRAASVVSRGRVDYGALHTVTFCGTVGANALAAGIPKLAAETDTAKLDDYMTTADNWADAGILNAAIQLANNASATPQARVYAVRHLITRLQPLHLFTYAGLAMSTDTTTLADGTRVWSNGCMGSIGSERSGTIVGSPLPADYEARIRATLATLAASQSAPAALRNAARCVEPARGG